MLVCSGLSCRPCLFETDRKSVRQCCWNVCRFCLLLRESETRGGRLFGIPYRWNIVALAGQKLNLEISTWGWYLDQIQNDDGGFRKSWAAFSVENFATRYLASGVLGGRNSGPPLAP